MRRSQVFNLASGFIMLPMLLFVQPVFSKDSKESDPKPSAFESGAGPGAVDAAPKDAALDSDSQKDEHFQLSPPLNDKEAKRSVVKHFAADIWTDQKAIWTSPFRMNRRQLLTIALPLAAATAGLIATDSRTSKALPNTTDQVDWSRRFSEFGAVYTLGVVTGGSLVRGKMTGNPDYTQIGRNAAEALVNAAITGYALKEIAGRERPNVDNGAGHFWKGGQSFPSGHTVNSWAVAIAIARTPNCPKWFAYTSYVMASAISFSRWSANQHFASDILVGGVVGGLIGNYVTRRHR